MELYFDLICAMVNVNSTDLRLDSIVLTDLVPMAEMDKQIEDGEAVELAKDGTAKKKSGSDDDEIDSAEEKKFQLYGSKLK